MLTSEQATKLTQEMFVLGSIEDFDLDQILELLTAADDLYTNDGESILTDSQYDTLKQYAHRLAPSHVYFTGVGSNVRGGKVKLPYKMGSLTQSYQGDLKTWVKKHNLEKDRMFASDKLDGVSVLMVFGERKELQIAYSRGDGVEGADVTRHVSKIHNVPKTVQRKMVVRAEVIIKEKNFQILKTKVSRSGGATYKNARNMTAGLMNASEKPAVVYQYLDVVAYEVIEPAGLDKWAQFELLTQNKFDVAYNETFKGTGLTDEAMTKYLIERRKDNDYAIDGLVIEVDDAKKRAKINPTKDTLNPEYARKFKVADDSNLAIATVKEVEWNISKDGYLKPRVCVHPIELVGVTIQHATGFNAKFISENKIGPGAQVKITRSGDVIPFILEVVKPAKQAQMPTHEAVWSKTGVDLVLKNISSNVIVKFEIVNDFFASIDAPHLREGNLQTIFDAGFETPESIIELTQEDFASLLGSQPIGRKVFQGLRDKLTNIPLYELMGSHSAFGRGVGVRKMKKLYEAFDGDMTKCASVPNILVVEGFEQKTASKIVAGYPKFQEFLKKIKKYVTIAPYQSKKGGSMNGQTFVFTGFRSSELELAIEDKGGKMGSAVSSKTTYLVAEDKDSKSGKAVKARALGVKVIGQADLIKMLGL